MTRLEYLKKDKLNKLLKERISTSWEHISKDGQYKHTINKNSKNNPSLKISGKTSVCEKMHIYIFFNDFFYS